MCLVARDAHGDIGEWLAHHRRLGVTRVYVWDNASTPPMEEVLREHIASGLVVYSYFDAFEHPTNAPQLYAYDRCLEQGRGMHDWMAFIDVDEFLIFRGGGSPVRSLPQYLTNFMQSSGEKRERGREKRAGERLGCGSWAPGCNALWFKIRTASTGIHSSPFSSIHSATHQS